MSLQLTLFEAVTWFLLFTSLQRCSALGTQPHHLFPLLMTGRAEHARHPRREVITTPIFHIRMPSVGSQGDPPAAEPGCDPRREDGSGTGRRGRHAGPEAAACLRDAARRFRPPAFWSSRHVPGTPFGAAFPVTLTPHPHDRLVAEGRLRLSQSRTARPRRLTPERAASCPGYVPPTRVTVETASQHPPRQPSRPGSAPRPWDAGTTAKPGRGPRGFSCSETRRRPPPAQPGRAFLLYLSIG